MSDKEQNETKPVISTLAIDDKSIVDLSQAIGVKVSDFLDEKILTVSPVPQKKFKTNYTDNTVDNDAEKNFGEYIIDDSQYIDFKKLLQRSAQCSKNPQQGVAEFLSQFPVVDNVGGIDEKDLQNVIDNNETEVSEVSSNELSTGATERPQEAGVVANPVENLADVVSEAETNSEK